jgi:hypothetical protein
LTPEEFISTEQTGGRPRGIIREHLPDEKIAEIPILDEMVG